MSASHSRAADSTSVSSTACRSKVERLMTLSTSAVAVCCCSDSRSSLSRRVFSMAMTAWAAKFCDQLDLLVGERPHLLAVDDDGADQLVVLEHRHHDQCASARESTAATDERVAFELGRVVLRSAIGPPVWSRDAAEGDFRRRIDTVVPRALRRHGRAAHRAMAPRRKPSPSHRNSMPNLASQMRGAFASMAWNTGSSSPGEPEMTRSTSEVAVCCSSASAACCRAVASVRLASFFGSACFCRSAHVWRPEPRALRLRSGRTRLATVRSALRAFARHRHLVGTSIDPGSPGEPRKTISRPGRRCVRRA